MQKRGRYHEEISDEWGCYRSEHPEKSMFEFERDRYADRGDVSYGHKSKRCRYEVKPSVDSNFTRNGVIHGVTRSFFRNQAKRFDFRDEIEFVKAQVIGGEKYEVKTIDEDLLPKSGREALPIYPFKESLLRAVNDYQVLLIIDETGSGKTTQILQYLHEAGYSRLGKIGCTQPRRVAALSVAERVAKEMRVKLGHEVGYSVRFEGCTSSRTVIKYMTDGILLQEFLLDPELSSYSVVMIDEAHERTLSTDILFGLLKDVIKRRKDLKLLITSATLDAVKFSDYFDLAPVFKIPGRSYPVEVFYTVLGQNSYIDAAVVTIFQIHRTEARGDILVFLTGQDEIETVEKALKDQIRKLGRRIGALIVYSIYANMPTELQGEIFEPARKGVRKVVLATNIAEASLTIEGISYVIDSGYCKMKSYDHERGMETLLVNPISRASALQRAGRSGRTGPGKCYRLYTDFHYRNVLEEKTVPEIQRANLANVALTLKSVGISDLSKFNFMDPPTSQATEEAQNMLFALGAVDSTGNLTEIGRRMAEFPLEPMLSKMIVASELFNCSEEIVTIAAMLSVGNSIFNRPKRKGEQDLADEARMKFYKCSAGNAGDHIALLKVYNCWKESNYSTQWCHENYIQVRGLRRAKDIRHQLKLISKRVGIKLTSIGKGTASIDPIKMAITAGFFYHAAQSEYSGEGGAYRTLKKLQTVFIHPSSGLAPVLPKFVVYHELVLTSKEFMRQTTEIEKDWLLEIAPHYFDHKDIEDNWEKQSDMEKIWGALC